MVKAPETGAITAITAKCEDRFTTRLQSERALLPDR